MMANFKDISEVIGGGKEEGKMAESMKMSDDMKNKAIMSLNQIRNMLDEEGIDGAAFIVSHFGGERESSEKRQEDPSQKKALIIEVMKRRMGE
ncbi:hypothetical protein GOV11_04135 [Candidatus Woesearchaeota archaeon]|nr:hypothetical protein [Candidatus Woesearchaeota archaeon]